MAKACSVCSHDSRLAIEQAILAGKALSAIARNFGLTYTRRSDQAVVGDHKIVERHRDRCMPDAYQRAMAEREDESGVAMAARLRYLDEQVDAVIERAAKGEPVMVGDVPLLDDDGRQVLRYDHRLLLAAVREARGNVELLAKLSGRTEQDPQNLDALRRHLENPKARRLLAELEALAAADEAADTQAP